MARVGIGGTGNGYGVLVLGDTLAIEPDGLGRFVAATRGTQFG
jgi:hypothetical protein